MKKITIAYRIVTVLFILMTLPGAIFNLIQPEMVVEMMNKLGLPPHILTLMGIWKTFGIAALIASMVKSTTLFKRIGEWAYAGFFFDLTGAAFLHGAAGDMEGIAPPLVLVTVLIISFVLREKIACCKCVESTSPIQS